MIPAIVILSLIIIILLLLLFLLYRRSNKKITIKEIQIKSLLTNYNDSQKKIKDIENAMEVLKKTGLKNDQDYLNLLDSL